MLRLVERYIAPIVCLLIVLVSSAYALGCRRCGRSNCGGGCFGYVKPYVAPVIAAPDTNVFVVQANYPAPLVGQGGSPAYAAGLQGFSQQSLPLLDVNLHLQSQLQLIRAAGDTNALANERFTAMVQRVAEIQAPAVERLAAGSAAAAVLNAAGLNPSVQGVAQSQAVLITRDQAGVIQVQQVDQSAIASMQQRWQAGLKPIDPVPGPNPGPPPEAFPVESSALATFCYKCHGSALATPAKGFRLGDSPELAASMEQKFFKISKHVSAGSMPPADYKPQPTDKDRVAILDEIDAIIQKHQSQGVER